MLFLHGKYIIYEKNKDVPKDTPSLTQLILFPISFIQHIPVEN